MFLTILFQRLFLSDLAKTGERAADTIKKIAIAHWNMIRLNRFHKQKREFFNCCCDGTAYVAKRHGNSVVTIKRNS